MVDPLHLGRLDLLFITKQRTSHVEDFAVVTLPSDFSQKSE